MIRADVQLQFQHHVYADFVLRHHPLNCKLQDLLGPALERLSPMERTAFVMRHYEGMCIEDIGRALGVHAGAAKHSVFRAVQKLRQAL